VRCGCFRSVIDRDTPISNEVPSPTERGHYRKGISLALERRHRSRSVRWILRKASVFCPGGARPPMEAMISFVDAYRDDHGVTSETCCAHGRSARYCRSPRQPTAPTLHDAPILRRHPRASSATSSCVQRSKGFSMRTIRSTACAKCGGRCCGRDTRSPAARSPG